MTITARSSLIDVCFAVCTALERQGNVAVLTGGSAATFYAPENYQSYDADFVIDLIGTNSALALTRLGFEEVDGSYRHADSKFTVEFLSRPIGIGNEVVRTWTTFTRATKYRTLFHGQTRSRTGWPPSIIGTIVVR